VVDQYETACIPEKMCDNKVAYIQDPSTDKSCLRFLKVVKQLLANVVFCFQLAVKISTRLGYVCSSLYRFMRI